MFLISFTYSENNHCLTILKVNDKLQLNADKHKNKSLFCKVETNYYSIRTEL